MGTAGNRIRHPGVDIVDSTTPGLASLLFAVALVRADPFLLAAILPVPPAILTPVHPIGLTVSQNTSIWNGVS